MKYIKSTIDYGIFYKKDMSYQIIGYYDANYASNHGTRHLTIGYIFALGSRAISWCSKRQPMVSLSSSEVEYRITTMVA